MQLLENIAPLILTVIGIVLAIQLPFALLTFFVALRERHRRAVYVPVDESQALPSNAYMDLTNAMAQKHGFGYLGVCRSGNDKLYKLRYDTWVSPHRHVFAVVGAGSMIGIPHQATWLTSKLIDGRVLITVDHPGAMAGDLSGMTEWKVIQNADFPELLTNHRARVEAEMTPVEPYSEHDPLGDHIELIAQRAERMARAGYISFLDDGRAEWRYTVWGALVRVCDSYKRAFVQIVRNYRRRTISRPGDSGYVSSQRGKTRSWLRYLEIGLWVAIVVMIGLSRRPPVTPQQAVFRAAVLLGAFLGLATIWVGRWWISRGTVDPRTRRRRWYAVAVAACLLFGVYFMTRLHRESRDDVADCKVLVGGGRVYVVVESLHLEFLTSPLAQFLTRTGRPGVPRVVSSKESWDIFESDGASTRSTTIAEGAIFSEVMPVGQHLYMIDNLRDGEMSQWRDGYFVPVPADEREKIQKGLAEDLAEQCAAQGWDYTSLAGARAKRLSKTIALGDRKVLLDIALEPSKTDSTRVLHAKIAVPGTEPLVRTFPCAQ